MIRNFGSSGVENQPLGIDAGLGKYSSKAKIHYDVLSPEPPLVSDADFIPILYSSLISLDYDEYVDRLLAKITSSSTGYLYSYDSLGNYLHGFTIPNYSVYRMAYYGGNYFIFSNAGWAKYSTSGTLIASGTDFALPTGDVDIRMQRVSESQVKAFQSDGTIKQFNMNTCTVEQTISLSNLYSNTYPFFDDDGNWYYQSTSMQLTKLNASGSIVFSGVANNFENAAAKAYKPFCIKKNNSILSARVLNGYFRRILVSTIDGSLINSQIVQVTTDTGLQCAYENLVASKKLLILRSTSTYYLYGIKIDDQAQGLSSTFKILLTTSNTVNGLYANGDDALFASYQKTGYPTVKKIQFNYQLA